jgi:integrase
MGSKADPPNVPTMSLASAGIASFSPHDCRRTIIGDLLEVADLSTAQILAGRSSPTTTQGYDRRGDEVRRAAVAKLNIPFV